MGGTTFFKAEWRRHLSVLLRGLVFLCLLPLLPLLLSQRVFALEPPRPGEIEQLKQTGEYEERFEKARALGNHLIDSDLLEQAIYRAQREALVQQGLNPDETLPAPPPARKLMPTRGNLKVFALLIDFLDYPGYSTQEAIHSALFGDGSGIPTNSFPYESLTSYYKRSSYNQLDLSSGVTLGWYHAPYERSWVSMTTMGRENLIKEAIAYLHNGLDFSQFDNDGDGQIEYFIVIWTGPHNGWANFWWGYQTDWSDSTYSVGGKKLGKYSWQWEGSYGSYGPFEPLTVIHETGHGLGLPDYYDYWPNEEPNGGVGRLDIMDGNWGDHNCFSKWVLEWITPTVVASGSLTLTLSPSGASRDAVLIMPGATSSDAFKEFFIVQNRYRVGNDPASGTPYPYPTDGMLIWHVDASLNSTGNDFAYDNSATVHKLLKLVQADGFDRIETLSARADAAMYYEPGKSFGPLTNPNSRDYLGVDTGVNVTDISQSWPQVTATFSIDNPRVLPILTVAVAGNGSGAVTSVPAGISCRSDCAQSYVPGTAVTLSAAPAPGSAFAGWSGGCSGTGTCTVTMSADTFITATFTTTLVLSQDFSDCVLPIGWTTVTIAGQGGWWFDGTPNQYYNVTGGLGCYALGWGYADYAEADIALKTPTISLAAYDSVELEFKTYIFGGDTVTSDVDVSIDDGATWTNAWRKIGWLLGQTVNVDLSAISGRHGSVMLRFHTYGYPKYWELDDIRITAVRSVPVVTVTALDSTATEGGDKGTFRITRTGATTLSLNVYFTMSGTAESGLDYSTITSPVMIPAGASYVDLTLTPINDSVYEGTETAILTILADEVNYDIASSNMATVTIQDNDPAPIVTVRAMESVVREAGQSTGTYRITRTGDTTSSLNVHFEMNGTAENGVDYKTITSPVTIPAGRPYVDMTLTAIDDSVCEGNETAILLISTNAVYGIGSPGSSTITIQDNEPTVTVTATDSTATEAGPTTGTYRISRTGATTSSLNVYFTMGGTAQDGVDYNTVASPVTIPAGASYADLTLRPIDDSVYEGNKTAIFTILFGMGYCIGSSSSATITIQDNEPTVTVTATDSTATEAGPTTGTYRITRTGATTSSLNVYFTMGGTAQNGGDYNTITSPVTIPAGRSYVDVTLTAIDDSVCEGNETAIFVISANAVYGIGSPGSATITIQDNEPVVTVTATDSTSAETGSTTGTYRISRTGATTSSLNVYFTMGGTAQNGVDYNTITSPVTIPAGASYVNVTLTPVDDSGHEGNETSILTISANAAYGIGSPGSATITIQDNEPVVTVTAVDSTATEAGPTTGTYRISRTGSRIFSLNVYFTMGGTAQNGVDYNTIASPVTIPAGASNASVTLKPIDDPLHEGTETAILTISADAAYGIGSSGSATITIQDND
jgi:M6 family metalloprotease-like protein